MRSSIGAGLLTVTLALGLSSAATPSRAAVSADLAKKCRAMMVEAHPSQFYGATGTAAAQRDYFKQCISRQGRMDNKAEPTTTEGQPIGRGRATQGACERTLCVERALFMNPARSQLAPVELTCELSAPAFHFEFEIAGLIG